MLLQLTLRYRAFDGFYEDFTEVTVNIMEMNLFPPMFAPTVYTVADITELDSSISSRNPRFMTQVSHY